MTVLHPWPDPIHPMQRPAADSAAGPGWRVLRPAGPLKANTLPPCEPSPGSLASHFSLDLSSLRKVRPALARHTLALRAGTAELLLLQRLRARTRRELNKETLEQAARIIEVTARDWFGEDTASAAAAS